MTTIGLKIKQRREELGITQEELAKRLGYKSKSTINKIEMGINDITQSKIVLFANALSTTSSYLMGWEDEEKVADSLYTLTLSTKMQQLVEVSADMTVEEFDRLIEYAEFIKLKREGN